MYISKYKLRGGGAGGDGDNTLETCIGVSKLKCVQNCKSVVTFRDIRYLEKIIMGIFAYLLQRVWDIGTPAHPLSKPYYSYKTPLYSLHDPAILGAKVKVKE